VNRFTGFLAAIAIGAITLSACGGGGDSSTTPGTGVPAAKAARKSSPQPSLANRTVTGSAVLTLALPKTLTGKNAQAIHAVNGAHTASSSTKRGPAYVNPTVSTVLDIFVNGTLIPNLDGTVGNNDSIEVQNSNSGTQSVTVPLFSGNQNDIVAVEWDSTSHSVLLAVGNAYVGNFAPGSTINAEGIGIIDIYSESDPQIMTGQAWYGVGQSCGDSGFMSQFALYDADALGTFVPVAGYGGTTTPVITASPDPGGQTTVAQTTIPGLYFVQWDPNCDGVTVSASAANPAFALVADSAYDAPNETFGYYYCYYENESCPAGPNQAYWNFENVYDEPYYPTNSIGGQTVTGSVDVEPTSEPTGD
jgi:hypothetical protein